MKWLQLCNLKECCCCACSVLCVLVPRFARRLPVVLSRVSSKDSNFVSRLAMLLLRQARTAATDRPTQHDTPPRTATVAASQQCCLINVLDVELQTQEKQQETQTHMTSESQPGAQHCPPAGCVSMLPNSQPHLQAVSSPQKARCKGCSAATLRSSVVCPVPNQLYAAQELQHQGNALVAASGLRQWHC